MPANYLRSGSAKTIRSRRFGKPTFTTPQSGLSNLLLTLSGRWINLTTLQVIGKHFFKSLIRVSHSSETPRESSSQDVLGKQGYMASYLSFTLAAYMYGLDFLKP